MHIKIGADPELFVSRDGKIFSGHGLVKGDKANPHPVKDGAVQVDGMALEFNIDPANTEEEFVHNIGSVIGQLSGMIPPDCKLELVPVAHFEPEYLAMQPEVARVIGCDPDFSAYTGGMNDTPDSARPMRTAAGHVHIGWLDRPPADDHFIDCQAVSRQMDYYLGIPSLIFDPDNTRREMYGKAGAFRPKDYGVEYRTLSNFWLQSEQKMRFVYNQVLAGMNELVAGDTLSDRFGTLARDIINNNQIDEAARFVERCGWKEQVIYAK
jgi:hypothetical protein